MVGDGGSSPQWRRSRQPLASSYPLLIYKGPCLLELFLFFFFFNTILVFIFVYFLAVPCSFLDFSSPNGNQTWGSAVEIPRPNHWTTRELHEAISILSRRVWSSLGG